MNTLKYWHLTECAWNLKMVLYNHHDKHLHKKSYTDAMARELDFNNAVGINVLVMNEHAKRFQHLQLQYQAHN